MEGVGVKAPLTRPTGAASQKIRSMPQGALRRSGERRKADVLGRTSGTGSRDSSLISASHIRAVRTVNAAATSCSIISAWCSQLYTRFARLSIRDPAHIALSITKAAHSTKWPASSEYESSQGAIPGYSLFPEEFRIIMDYKIISV